MYKMSRKMSNVPMIHGQFIDTVNYERLMEVDSTTVVKNETTTLNMKKGESKDAPKKMIYSARRAERNTQKDIYCGKRK
jgi:hypothetical protein